MKIFLCWSGARSRAVAAALNDWLPRVIQAVKPFYSPEIEKGVKWSNEIDDALEGTRFGIICLTPDNLNSTWIHFEAGALSKTKDALIWTFLHGLSTGDVPPPLGKFQHSVSEKPDALRLLRALNGRIPEVGGEPLRERLLDENFELFWPQLEERLKDAESLSSTTPPEKNDSPTGRPRDERAILDEILELARSIQRQLTAFEERPPNTSNTAISKSMSSADFYPEVIIRLRSKEPTVDDDAHRLSEALSELLPGPTIEINKDSRGPFVRIVFGSPVHEHIVEDLIVRASRKAACGALAWGPTR